MRHLVFFSVVLWWEKFDQFFFFSSLMSPDFREQEYMSTESEDTSWKGLPQSGEHIQGPAFDKKEEGYFRGQTSAPR